MIMGGACPEPLEGNLNGRLRCHCAGEPATKQPPPILCEPLRTLRLNKNVSDKSNDFDANHLQAWENL